MANLISRILPVLKNRGATWIVFGTSTYQSFGHSIHVASQHGAHDPWLLPVSIDGVMLVAFSYNYLAAPAGDMIGQGLSVAPAVGMISTTVLMHLVPKTKTPARRRPVSRKNVTPITKAKRPA